MSKKSPNDFFIGIALVIVSNVVGCEAGSYMTYKLYSKNADNSKSTSQKKLQSISGSNFIDNYNSFSINGEMKKYNLLRP